MNIAALMGRLTKDPDVRYNGDIAVARFTLAVDRRPTKDGKREADFISCVCFGKTAEFAEKFLKQGTKIAVQGRIQTGSYEKQDGTRVYTTDVIIENCDFCEKRSDAQEGHQNEQNAQRQTSYQPRPQTAVYGDPDAFKRQSSANGNAGSGFMDVPEGFEGGVPFA